MGMRGRAKRPAAIEIIRGNPGRRPVAEDPPELTRGECACPEFLTQKAQAEWRRVYPLLRSMRLMTEVDRGALAMLCQTWADYEVATKDIERNGVQTEVLGENGATKYFAPNPYVAIQKSALASYMKLAAQFGFSPSSRRAILDPKSGDDPLGEFWNEAR